MADDDAIRADHTEALVAAAQEHRHELCYGRQLVRFPEGETMELGEFPPSLGQFGLQAAVYHAGLSFFEQEPVDALYAEPNDWSLCRRMLAAGVRVDASRGSWSTSTSEGAPRPSGKPARSPSWTRSGPKCPDHAAPSSRPDRWGGA